MCIFLHLSERQKTLFTFILSHAEWLFLFETQVVVEKQRRTVVQATQASHPFDIVLLIIIIIKIKTGTCLDFRFIRVEICMLRTINFSWLSHYEHSQAEGANAKLICVLKLLSQASITGKCSDYSLGTKEAIESTAQ